MTTLPSEHLAALAGHESLKDISLAFLEKPRRVITINVPVVLDSGEERVFTGHRVQYDDTLGPTKGGLRFHPDADVAEVTELAFLMTLKTSLVGLPYGGAKGALEFNPRDYSSEEHERITRAFARQIAPFIGEDIDIPAPDVNTGADTMRVMLDEYEKVVGKKSPATFTGKHIEDGGSEGREAATGQGGFYVLEAFLAGRTPADVRVIVQGFGNVGAHLAELLFDAGYRVVGVSDSSGGVHDDAGLNIPELLEWKSAGNKLIAYEGAARVSHDELLALKADVLAPSALGGVITKENAHTVGAHVILEMANGPVTPEADEILKAADVVVIPDILANAGGVIVSYFEWFQNKKDETWDEARVNRELKERIEEAFERVAARAAKSGDTLRTASYVEAIHRIADARANSR